MWRILLRKASLEKPVGYSAGTTLILQLQQDGGKQRNLGRIRLKMGTPILDDRPLEGQRVVRRRLGWPEADCVLETPDAHGPGNVVLLEIASEQVTEVFTGFGEPGVRACVTVAVPAMTVGRQTGWASSS